MDEIRSELQALGFKRKISSHGSEEFSALGFLFSQFIAGSTEVNLHLVPSEPVAIPLRKNQSALKALKLFFR